MTDPGSGEFDLRDFLTSFREMAVGVLMAPRAFFQEMRRTGGILPPFLFLLTCLLIHTLIVGLYMTLASRLGPIMGGAF